MWRFDWCVCKVVCYIVCVERSDFIYSICSEAGYDQQFVCCVIVRERRSWPTAATQWRSLSSTNSAHNTAAPTNPAHGDITFQHSHPFHLVLFKQAKIFPYLTATIVILVWRITFTTTKALVGWYAGRALGQSRPEVVENNVVAVVWVRVMSSQLVIV